MTPPSPGVILPKRDVSSKLFLPRSVTRALTRSRSPTTPRAAYIQSRTERLVGGSKPSTLSAERKRSALIGTFISLLRSKQAQYQYPCEAYRPYGKITRSVTPDSMEPKVTFRDRKS